MSNNKYCIAVGRRKHMLSVHGEELKRSGVDISKVTDSEIFRLVRTVILELYRKSGNNSERMLATVWDIVEVANILNCAAPMDAPVTAVVSVLNDSGCFKARRRIKFSSGGSAIYMFKFSASVLNFLDNE